VSARARRSSPCAGIASASSPAPAREVGVRARLPAELAQEQRDRLQRHGGFPAGRVGLGAHRQVARGGPIAELRLRELGRLARERGATSRSRVASERSGSLRGTAAGGAPAVRASGAAAANTSAFTPAAASTVARSPIAGSSQNPVASVPAIAPAVFVA